MVSWIDSMMVLLFSYSFNGLKLHPREHQSVARQSQFPPTRYLLFCFLLLHEIEDQKEEDDDMIEDRGFSALCFTAGTHIPRAMVTTGCFVG